MVNPMPAGLPAPQLPVRLRRGCVLINGTARMHIKTPIRTSLAPSLLGFALMAGPGVVWPQCATSMTATNELVIRAGAGPCDAAALREGVTTAVVAANAADAAASSAPKAGALADVRRNPGQSALWRLSQMNAKPAQSTTIVMPGMSGKP
jgi:hypothetical protein